MVRAERQLTVEKRLLNLLSARHDKGSVLHDLLLEGLASDLVCSQVSWNTMAVRGKPHTTTASVLSARAVSFTPPSFSSPESTKV